MARTRELETFLRQLEKAIKKANKLNEENPQKLEDGLNDVRKSVIKDWYATYDPLRYGRQYGLFDVVRITRRGSHITIQADTSNLPGYHQDSEIIYQNAFIQGYHGGSLGEGNMANIPFWRHPIPYYSEWYRSAYQSFSPWERMQKEMKSFSAELHKENQKYFDEKILAPLLVSWRAATRK